MKGVIGRREKDSKIFEKKGLQAIKDLNHELLYSVVEKVEALGNFSSTVKIRRKIEGFCIFLNIVLATLLLLRYIIDGSEDEVDFTYEIIKNFSKSGRSFNETQLFEEKPEWLLNYLEIEERPPRNVTEIETMRIKRELFQVSSYYYNRLDNLTDSVDKEIATVITDIIESKLKETTYLILLMLIFCAVLFYWFGIPYCEKMIRFRIYNSIRMMLEVENELVFTKNGYTWKINDRLNLILLERNRFHPEYNESYTKIERKKSICEDSQSNSDSDVTSKPSVFEGADANYISNDYQPHQYWPFFDPMMMQYPYQYGQFGHYNFNTQGYCCPANPPFQQAPLLNMQYQIGANPNMNQTNPIHQNYLQNNQYGATGYDQIGNPIGANDANTQQTGQGSQVYSESNSENSDDNQLEEIIETNERLEEDCSGESLPYNSEEMIANGQGINDELNIHANQNTQVMNQYNISPYSNPFGGPYGGGLNMNWNAVGNIGGLMGTPPQQMYYHPSMPHQYLQNTAYPGNQAFGGWGQHMQHPLHEGQLRIEPDDYKDNIAKSFDENLDMNSSNGGSESDIEINSQGGGPRKYKKFISSRMSKP